MYLTTAKYFLFNQKYQNLATINLIFSSRFNLIMNKILIIRFVSLVLLSASISFNE